MSRELGPVFWSYPEHRAPLTNNIYLEITRVVVVVVVGISGIEFYAVFIQRFMHRRIQSCLKVVILFEQRNLWP